jgi:hypothetical protein
VFTDVFPNVPGHGGRMTSGIGKVAVWLDFRERLDDVSHGHGHVEQLPDRRAVEGPGTSTCDQDATAATVSDPDGTRLSGTYP